MFDTVKSIQSRVEGLEQNRQSATAGVDKTNTSESFYKEMQSLLDNLNLTITASGIPISTSEDLIGKAENLIEALVDDIANNSVLQT